MIVFEINKKGRLGQLGLVSGKCGAGPITSALTECVPVQVTRYDGMVPV